MRALMMIAAAMTVASCSTPVAAPDETVVAEALAGRTPGPAQTCVNTNQAENLHVLNAQTVAYGYGRTIYINRLAAACPGLAQLNTVIVEAGTGGQYCRGDSQIEAAAVLGDVGRRQIDSNTFAG